MYLPLIADVTAPTDLLPRLLLGGLMLVNLLTAGYLLGGLTLSLLFQIQGRHKPDCNIIARRISHAVVPTRLWAWVLLVGPVAVCNLFYVLYLFSVDSPRLGWIGTLTPVAGMSVMLLYLHRLAWPADPRRNDRWHLASGLAAWGLALLMALIFLLKISPLPPVPDSFVIHLLETIPQLLHGLVMAVVMAAIILALALFGASSSQANPFIQMTLPQARKAVLQVAMIALFVQIAAGPFVLMTLHFEFMGMTMGIFLGLSILFSLTALLLLSADLNAAAKQVGRFLPHVMTLLMLTVFSMILTRQFYRNLAVSPGADVALTQATSNLEPDDPPHIRAMPGRQLYITHCNICHFNERMAPPMSEIYALHGQDVNAMVQWAMQPGTRRAQYGPMPPQRHLGMTRLKQIADYMVASAAYQKQLLEQPAATQPASPATP